MKSKKLIALLLASALCLGLLAGCGGTTQSTPTPGAENTTPVEPVKDTYTYNGALSAFPAGWNYHTYQTNTASTILSPLSDSFYTFDYNETRDGYKMVPHMVTGDPVDVTADYIGQYGLEEGAKNRAWKYTLRSDLKWDDGTPITAQQFVDSAERLLNPVAQNYRADGLYASSFVMHNAKAYLDSGRTTLKDNMTDKDAFTFTYQISDLVLGEDGVYTTPDGAKMYAYIDGALTWLDGAPLSKYADDKRYAGYFNLEHWEDLKAKMDSRGGVPLTEETLGWITEVIATEAWGETEENVPGYLAYDVTNPPMDFSEVGIFALSDTELVIVIDQELEGFYLKYYIGGDWLVKVDLYDSCTTVKDGVYSNTYGTSVETTASFGPYKLTGFQQDRQFAFEKNDNWWGFTSGEHANEYQTTNIVYDFVEKTSTRLELFLQGKLDGYGLDAADMATYQLSDHTYYTTSSSSFGMVFNPDLASLQEKEAAAGPNINKTILTVSEFRQALSFGLDRAAFALAVAPTNKPSFALYSDLIIYDPEAGSTYRSTEDAKKVVTDFWGVTDDIGPGKLYADADEAIASITGYNLELAKQKFDEAYDIAIAEGLMDADDEILLTIGQPSAANFYVNGAEFLINNYTDAVKGTKLEGKLKFNTDNTIGDAFSDSLKNNQVDILFGVGWTGSALDPFNLWQVYVMPNYVYDAKTDYSKVMVDVELTDGVTYTADAVTWCNIMSGEALEITAADGSKKTFSCGIADNDIENRIRILAASEGAVLQQYHYLPLIDDSSAQLKGMQINYGTEEYVFGMEFGGVQYYTYNYTDAEWDAFVAQNGGTLDYT